MDKRATSGTTGENGGAATARRYRFSLRRLTSVLLVAAIVLVLANIAAIAWLANQPDPDVESFRLVILDYEANLPTWFSTMLLALAAVLFRLHAGAAERRDQRYWNLFAILFICMSIDELVGFHERITDYVPALRFGGIFYYAWVVPALAGLCLLGAFIFPFLGRLREPLRRRLLISGFVYLSGAVGFEMIGGAWVERAGAMNAVYGVITTCEETLEIAGLWLLVRALSAEMESVRVRFSRR